MRAAVRREVRNVALVAAVLAVAPIPILGSSYYEGVLARMLLVAVLAVGLNIVFGHTDQLFLFMGGLAGIGAYGTALFADWTGLTAWVTLPFSALLGGLIGLAVSWVSAKREFSVVLISILTLNLQLVLSEAFVGARDITGGSTGFPYREYFSLSTLAGPLGIPEKVVLYYLVLVLLVAVLLVYIWLTSSRYGVAFDAIREDEVAAASVGVDVVYYKSLAGFVGAFVIAFTGAFMAREAAWMLPSEFSFPAVDVLVLIVLIVGGLRTTLGPVVGAAFVIGIEELLAAYAAGWRTAVFGALLIALFLYFRQGVVVAVADLVRSRPGAGGGSGGSPAEEPAD
ncbi:MAG: branched-chain amino acid ABC transporter permease [Halobacteriales archaeon]